jgi:hypothetical protein
MTATAAVKPEPADNAASVACRYDFLSLWSASLLRWARALPCPSPPGFPRSRPRCNRRRLGVQCWLRGIAP